MVGLLVVCIFGEEKPLARDLEGYKEYLQKVRYRVGTTRLVITPSTDFRSRSGRCRQYPTHWADCPQPFLYKIREELPVIRPKHFMALGHPRCERREPQCSGVGNYAPRISKRLIKPFSIRNM